MKCTNSILSPIWTNFIILSFWAASTLWLMLFGQILENSIQIFVCFLCGWELFIMPNTNGHHNSQIAIKFNHIVMNNIETHRSLSTNLPYNCELHDYNYQHVSISPTRFKKDVIRAAKPKSMVHLGAHTRYSTQKN